MKTLMRHGLAVSLALTTMCTSLLLMYGSIGNGGSGGGSNDGAGGRRVLKEQVQQQVAATTPLQKPESQRPSSTTSPRPFPGLADRLLEGYISVLDHKGMLSLYQLLLASVNELTRQFWTLFKQYHQLH